EVTRIVTVGFPSFLSEAGLATFIVGYNIVMAIYAGTAGLAAFSVINYLHFFMFLVFQGIGAAIQPMISYYYGASGFNRMKASVLLAEKSALFCGILSLCHGFFSEPQFVVLFEMRSG